MHFHLIRARCSTALLLSKSRVVPSTSSSISSLVLFSCLQNGLLSLNLGPHLTNANGIGLSTRQTHPNNVHAQPTPNRSYIGAVANVISSAAAMFLLNTELASADAE